MARKSSKKKGASVPPTPEVGGPGRIPVFIPERFREGGAYANIANISVSDDEVVLTFVFADQQGASVVSKVILSHRHANNFIKVFQKTVENHKGKKKGK